MEKPFQALFSLLLSPFFQLLQLPKQEAEPGRPEPWGQTEPEP
jgi:hypothetical protein